MGWGKVSGGFLSGLGQGIQQFGQMWAQQAMREMNAAREERLVELRHQHSMAETEHREQVRRAPYQQAAEVANARIGEANDALNPVANDEEGNPLPRAMLAAGEVSKIRAQAYDEAGLPEVGSRVRTEALAAEKLDLERTNLQRREAQDQRQHEERMQVLQKQLNVQEKQLARQYALDKNQSTALTTNVRFLVDQGIAKDPAEAFSLLRTRMEKSPEQTLEQLTMQLLRSGDPRYRGKDGPARATEDARALMGRIRAGEEAAFERGFNGVRSGSSSGAARRRPLDAFMGGEE